jgi:zinc transport system substrate-binding protein
MVLMKTSSLRFAAAGVALAVPLVAGCGGASTGADTATSGTRVVTSFYPLEYVAERVAGDHADVENLTQPGREPHDLELTVQQTKDIADSEVVLYEKGFQPDIDDAIQQNGPEHVVDAATAAHLAGDDPHFWLDPTRLGAVADAFERAVADADPRHAAAYARNLASLRADLADLDRGYRRGLAHCDVGTIVVSHDAFGYLGQRYGLRVVGINGLSPDAEPSPAHVRQLQDLIGKDHITTVFSERLASREFAQSIAGDLGIRTAVLDPIEGLSDTTADQDYLSLMRSNLATLRTADRCA